MAMSTGPIPAIPPPPSVIANRRWASAITQRNTRTFSQRKWPLTHILCWIFYKLWRVKLKTLPGPNLVFSQRLLLVQKLKDIQRRKRKKKPACLRILRHLMNWYQFQQWNQQTDVCKSLFFNMYSNSSTHIDVKHIVKHTWMSRLIKYMNNNEPKPLQQKWHKSQGPEVFINTNYLINMKLTHVFFPLCF